MHVYVSITNYIIIEMLKERLINLKLISGITPFEVESNPHYLGIHSALYWIPLRIVLESIPHCIGIHSEAAVQLLYTDWTNYNRYCVALNFLSEHLSFIHVKPYLFQQM